jgi:arylsulfatase A-like enzyme
MGSRCTSLLAAALLFVGCAVSPEEHSPAEPRPQNVVLIVLDDVSPGLLGAYDRHYASLGRPSVGAADTPAIDTLLAARGMTFTRAWANPKCTPTRAQLLTGLHGLRSGVGQVVMAGNEERTSGLAPSFELLSTRLAESPAGYATAAVGKWHLSGVDELARNPLAPLGEPRGRWFQHYAGSLFNLGEDREAQPEDGGYWRWEKFHATALGGDARPCGDATLPCTTVEDGRTVAGYPTVDTTDDALALVRALPEPWFLYVAYNAVHEPLHHVTLDLPRAPGVEPRAPACDHSDPSDAAMVRCMMAALDSQLGRLVSALDEQDTTVILVGDNGMAQRAFRPPYMRHHGKGTMFSGGVEVPLIVRSPTIPAELRGSTSSALALPVDVFATVADLCGVGGDRRESLSLAPALRGSHKSYRGELYSERFQPNFFPDAAGRPPADFAGRFHDQALSDGRFKLIRETSRGEGGEVVRVEQLFAVPQAGEDEDWTERRNLLLPGAEPLAPAAAEALASLRARLDANYPSLVR